MKLIRFEAVVDVVAVAEDKDGRPKHFAIKEIQPFVIASDEFLFNLLLELGEAGEEAYFRCDFAKVQAELDSRLAEWQAYLDSLPAEEEENE